MGPIRLLLPFMPKVKLNHTEYDVESGLLEAVSNRLTQRLLQARNMSRTTPIDYQSVRAELLRLYPALPKKPWWWDFVQHFCTQHQIYCPAQDDGGRNVIVPIS